MTFRQMTLDEILAERGIADPAAFLCRTKAALACSATPLVEMRGDVHLMLGRTLGREEVDRRLAALKYL